MLNNCLLIKPMQSLFYSPLRAASVTLLIISRQAFCRGIKAPKKTVYTVGCFLAKNGHLQSLVHTNFSLFFVAVGFCWEWRCSRTWWYSCLSRSSRCGSKNWKICQWSACVAFWSYCAGKLTDHDVPECFFGNFT